MTQMDLEKFLLMLDTERARLMLKDLMDDTKRSPQLYNAIMSVKCVKYMIHVKCY